jgi:hypothetical protein
MILGGNTTWHITYIIFVCPAVLNNPGSDVASVCFGVHLPHCSQWPSGQKCLSILYNGNIHIIYNNNNYSWSMFMYLTFILKTVLILSIYSSTLVYNDEMHSWQSYLFMVCRLDIRSYFLTINLFIKCLTMRTKTPHHCSLSVVATWGCLPSTSGTQPHHPVPYFHDVTSSFWNKYWNCIDPLNSHFEKL